MEGENLKLIFPQLYYNNVARSDSAVGHLCGDFWRLLYNFRSWPFCWGRKGRCWVPQVFFQGATFHHSHHVRWVSGRIFDVETIFAPFSPVYEKKRGKIRALIKWHKSVSGVTCGVLWWFSLWMTPFGTNRNSLLVGQHLQSLSVTVLRILMPPATYGTGRGASGGSLLRTSALLTQPLWLRILFITFDLVTGIIKSTHWISFIYL